MLNPLNVLGKLVLALAVADLRTGQLEALDADLAALDFRAWVPVEITDEILRAGEQEARYILPAICLAAPGLAGGDFPVRQDVVAERLSAVLAAL